MEKREPLQWMMLGKLDSYMEKNESIYVPYTCTKINSDWITDLNIKCKTIYRLENNIGENVDDLGLGMIF